ncbi:MAG TPA: hypothetical protein VFS08_17595 [Gemmatimonadaceae bacterium]|nr:hypothetical protein [Gemmatimonadaceae bacterium]
MRRSRGRVAFAVVFALLALNAGAQVVLALLHRSDDPSALTTLQALVSVTAAAAAWGSWTVARWAPGAALLYGLVTAAMLVSLEPMLDLPAEARVGLWTGGATVLLFGLWAAWYLRRDLARRAPPERAPSA